MVLKVAHAQEQKFTALLGGNQEVPPNTSTAKGSASFKPMGDTIWYNVNVTGIDKVTMMHIHSGKVGENGDPIAMLQIEKSTGPTNGLLAQGNITSSDLMGHLQERVFRILWGKCRVEKLMLMFIPKPIPMGKSEDN